MGHGALVIILLVPLISLIPLILLILLTSLILPNMQANTNKFSWFQVPEDIKNLLILAAQNWENTSESEKYIQQALAQTSENTDVLVAAYRFFYYKNNYSLALQTTIKLLDKIKELEKFPDDWEPTNSIVLKCLCCFWISTSQVRRN